MPDPRVGVPGSSYSLGSLEPPTYLTHEPYENPKPN